jgi:hypothetical protein
MMDSKILNQSDQLDVVSTTTRLSFLWVFVLLNVCIRDLHTLLRSDVIGQIQSGVMNGTAITDELLLIGGILMEIPVAMIVLNQVMHGKSLYVVNIAAAALTLAIFLSNGFHHSDDYFFLGVTTMGLIGVVIVGKSRLARPTRAP